MNEILSRISEVFEGKLPGWEAHQKMINYDRPPPDNISEIDPQARKGAVLALLYPKEGQLHTVLTLRNDYDGHHSGQVSFPGGKLEKEDNSLWAAALRETNEEIGVNSNGISQLGDLTQVYIPPSRFLVSPFLAYRSEAPSFTRDEIEVKDIIETPVSKFLDGNLRKEKPIYVAALNGKMNVKYFDINGHVVWGATAMILSEIAEIMRCSLAD